MNNKWSEHFGVEFPSCKMTGQCCRCASPSVPALKLIEKAAVKDEFARDFFSIFIPYKNIDEAREIAPDIVEKSLKSAEKPDNEISAENIVFYHCRYISDDNKCLIHEDRPKLCRDYPDSPYIIFAETCAYKEWAQLCKEKHLQLEEELRQLKMYKKELENLKYQNKLMELSSLLQRTDRNYHFLLLVPSLSLVSPGASWIKLF